VRTNLRNQNSKISIYREKYSDFRFFEAGPGVGGGQKSPFGGDHLSEIRTKKSSDLALKMQRSGARFAGIWTRKIDQVNP
jgi:hypothetical protein